MNVERLRFAAFALAVLLVPSATPGPSLFKRWAEGDSESHRREMNFSL